MKIEIKEPIASHSWSYKRGTIVDTSTDPNITEAEAIRLLAAGIAVPVKEPEKKGKKTATLEKKPEVS